eukprot:TRINITY_DN12243_c0_g1_i1.p1 TRINITY_DN12243_c0_g1~~TRINITY_DN12243_c0_g1_i1.p1  ORF type:complete len:686 (-),score=204.63 TRINITY_DN12243_c0_g1_i1:134-2191(-)
MEVMKRSGKMMLDSVDFDSVEDPMVVDPPLPVKTEKKPVVQKRQRVPISSDSDLEPPVKKSKVVVKKETGAAVKAKATKKAVVKKAPVKKEKKPPVKKRATKATATKKPKKEEPVLNRWWEQDYSWRVGEKANWKWQTLRHQGVHFTDEYKPHGKKMKYDGKLISLPAEAEMLASFFARYLDHPHMAKPQFSQNFFKEFRKVLGRKHQIKDYKKCDFRPLQAYLSSEAEKRRNRSKAEKDIEKGEKAELKAKYGWAVMDGNKEQIGNYVVEPPGLFLGRGDHPKAGMRKMRIQPEDVTLNLDEDAPIPPCPVKGHKWGAIVHKHDVTWIATWKNSISGEPKYVFFAANSTLKGVSDRSKYEKARKLRTYIDKIRLDYMADLKSKDPAISQRATALWIVDHLALRVGGEKGEDEAETYGCCSLRVDHISMNGNNKIEFDFLGKDSMRYHNTVAVIPLVYTNITRFLKKKKKSDQVFDQLQPQQLNQYLQTLMPGLTAKVFRTYNASVTMEAELNKKSATELKKLSPDEQRMFFNQCSIEVAILCNHQRSKPPTHDASMDKLKLSLKDLKQQHKALVRYGKEQKKGNDPPHHDHEGWPKFPKSYEATKKKANNLKERIKRQEIKIEDKNNLAEVATSTAKINYIDPRVTIAWAKKIDLPLQKVFSKTIRDKFNWAIAEVEADKVFKF